jgi:hypothetical protein
MSFKEKARETLEFCEEQIRAYENPVLFWSGGKDSMVLLHLMYSHGIRMPVVYFRDPFFPRKNRFVNLVIDSYLLECHDYPPLRVSLKHHPDMVALVSEYWTGPASVASVLKNTIEFKNGDDEANFLCGVSFLMRPVGTFKFPWNAAFVGHKDCDEDQIFGAIPLHSKIVYRDEGPDFIFPLKEWSHADIWDYTEHFDVPIQADRYDVANRREWPDKTFNSDWYPVCIRCVDKRTPGATVYCPKMKRNLVNVSGAAAEFGWVPDYFGEKK